MINRYIAAKEATEGSTSQRGRPALNEYRVVEGLRQRPDYVGDRKRKNHESKALYLHDEELLFVLNDQKCQYHGTLKWNYYPR